RADVTVNAPQLLGADDMHTLHVLVALGAVRRKEVTAEQTSGMEGVLRQQMHLEYDCQNAEISTLQVSLAELSKLMGCESQGGTQYRNIRQSIERLSRLIVSIDTDRAFFRFNLLSCETTQDN